MLQDDQSGRQQWTFTPVAGGYSITVVRGRAACGQVSHRILADSLIHELLLIAAICRLSAACNAPLAAIWCIDLKLNSQSTSLL